MWNDPNWPLSSNIGHSQMWNSIEFRREYNRRYREKNRDKISVQQRKYREKRKPDQVRVYQRSWRAKNRDKVNAKSKAWRLTNPEKYRANIQKHLQKRIPFLALLNRYKKWKGCSLCDFKESSYALEFHHIKPEEKAFDVSMGWCRNWGKVKEEIRKCVVVCANCHRRLEAGELTLSQMKE